MAINSRCYAIILFFLIWLSPVIGAQTSGYFIDPNSVEPRFIQRLAWRGGEYALRYEVIIERGVNGRYQSHLREFTTALFINVSLAPGEYRFRVIPYDVLDRPGVGSQWMPFVVRLALQPELYNFTQYFFYGKDDVILVLSIDGSNLVPGAEVYLLDEKGTRFFPDEIDSGDENNIWLFFDNDQLKSGNYEIIVRNPGGLEAGMGGIFVSFPEPKMEHEPEPEVEPEPETEPVPESKVENIPEPEKPFLLITGVTWMPVLPVYGESFSESVYHLAGSAGFGVILPVSPNLYVGPEFTWTMYSLKDALDIGATIGANLLLHKRLSNGITSFNFRLGASYVLPPGDVDLTINMGATFYVNFLKYFYVEMGLDYVHFADRLFTNSALGWFRPLFGIGFQL